MRRGFRCLRRLIFGIAAASTLGAATGAAASCKLNQIMELPVTMVGLKPTVMLLVNGHPTRFLVDSGSQFSLIDANAAQALGLKLAKTNEKYRGAAGEVDLEFTTIDSLAIGKDASLGKVDMLAAADVAGGGYAGLIGENVLGFADIEYDLPHGAIRFFKQDDCKGANLGYWGQPAAVEIDLSHTGRRPESRDRDPNHYDPGDLNRDVRAAVLVNGQKVLATFDTGSETSILGKAVAARLGVTPDTPGAVAAGAAGSEQKAAWIAPFDSFALGDERINHTRLRFGDIDRFELRDEHINRSTTGFGDLKRVPTEMLLGADFFLSHRVFVANSLSKAFISYVGGPVFNVDGANVAAKAGAPGKDDATGAPKP